MSSLLENSNVASRFFSDATTSGGKFLNPVPTVVTRPGQLLHMLRRLATKGRRGEPKRKLGPFVTDITHFKNPPRSGLRVTWMGHSSLLIEMDGRRILTDPVWSDRASFVSFAGPKRFYTPPLALKDLPPLDAILLSHDHYDHLDRATMRRLVTGETPFICSVGMRRYLEKWGARSRQITELNWGETASVAGDIQITATPARHFSGRALWNRNETLWSSFVLRGPEHKIFFGADSGMFPGFQQIGEAFGPFDLTMLEIGAYDADWPDIHMGPDHAAEAHVALRGELLLPIHWGLFNLAFHTWQEPIERLLQAAEKKNISLFLPKPGQPTDVTSSALNTFWWEG